MSEGRSAVLLLDDHWQEVKPLLAGLSPDIKVICEEHGDRALSVIECHPEVGALLLDLRFDGQPKQGEQLLEEIKDRHPDLPIIVLTAVTDVALALSLVHSARKAHYYFVKDQVDTEQLAKAVENAIGYYKLARDRLRLTDRGAIVGNSTVMDRVLGLAAKAAQNNSPVLITGEPGTGKELIARAIHLNSARRTKPFVAVNCAALPGELVASELFGSVKGAFTGARDRKGYFEQAEAGTLFLDEVGELPFGTQGTLLRAVEYGEVQKVGGKTVSVDVRIIAATNRDVKSAIEERGFREDLYYRLDEFPIHLPPLRERPEDILDLAEYFLTTEHPGKTVTQEASEMLGRSHWPGNVRQLRSVLNRAALIAPNDELNEDLFSEIIGELKQLPSDSHGEWVDRILTGGATWADLKREFRSSGDTLRAILDQIISRWTNERGERPSGGELAALLQINRNHVNQILNQTGIRLRDYD